MQNKFMKLGRKAAAAATMLAMFASVNPAFAADVNATDFSDLMARQAVDAVGDHTVTMDLPATATDWDGDMVLTFEDLGGGTTWDFPTANVTGTCQTGSVTESASAANVIEVTLLDCEAGELQIIVTDATNDDTEGSHTVLLTGTVTDGTDDLVGSYATTLTDSDQVTVTAQVDPTITFDLDTGLTAGETGAPYDVDLGPLTVGAVNSSDGTDINSIFAQLETNATGGAVVTVLNANGTDGLASLSAPGDFIPSATTTMVAGTANYGLCVNSSTQTAGSFDEVGAYIGLTCTIGGPVNGTVVLDDTTPTSILDTNDDPLVAGAAQILVNAAIDTSTAAHNDYQDVLTFVATGTF